MASQSSEPLPIESAFSSSGLVPRATASLKPLDAIMDIDFVETATEYHVHADLPGIDKSEIDIHIENGLITFTAERRNNHEINEVHHKVQVHHVERRYGRVQRTIRLPSNADAERAKASFTNGVLELKLPKLESTAVRVSIN